MGFLEVGMHVRTKDGKMGKYIKMELLKPFITKGIDYCDATNYGKYSDNVLDLIKVRRLCKRK
jgi:hypothetical protein